MCICAFLLNYARILPLMRDFLWNCLSSMSFIASLFLIFDFGLGLREERLFLVADRLWMDLIGSRREKFMADRLWKDFIGCRTVLPLRN